jgi:DNA-binding transcriptional ArsR family regulator
MVESNYKLDLIFNALSDSTRRNILSRLVKAEMSVGEIAKSYKTSLAAISKHIQVLESAGLVMKKRKGKERIVIIVPHGLGIAREHLDRYAKVWIDRYDNLEKLLIKGNKV